MVWHTSDHRSLCRSNKSIELDDDNGPLTTGTCVEVDIDDGKVDQIESVPAEKCNRNK